VRDRSIGTKSNVTDDAAGEGLSFQLSLLDATGLLHVVEQSPGERRRILDAELGVSGDEGARGE
jgi:hypothetical protein